MWLKKRVEDQQAGSHNDTTDKEASLYGLIGPVLLGSKQSGPFESSKAQKHGQRSFGGLKKGSKEASLGPKVVLTCSKEETWAEDEDARPGVKGFSRSDPLVDPAWICAQGPLLDAHKNRNSLVDFVNFESCWEEGLWEVSSDCPLMGSLRQGPREEGILVGQDLDLVESVLRVPEVEVPEDHRSHVNGSKYETVPSTVCSSPLCSIFGRPLLSGGYSGLGVFHGHKAMGDLEPLRVVSTDGIEWGEMTTEALMEADHETVGLGPLSEELPKARPKCLGYDKWKDSCLIKFSEFLRVPTVGYEEEILELLRKLVSQQPDDKREGYPTESRCERELRKLECTINYNGKDQNRGGRDKGNFLLKLK